MNMQFYMPTRIISGSGCVRANSAALAALGKRALIVTGAHSARANGSLADVTAALDAEDVEWSLYDKVMSNPTIPCVYEGAAIARAEQADFVIAIGGGSPMDAGKAIALLAAQDVPEEKLFTGPFEHKILPMALIPTTAGTGSEVTQYSILTNDAAKTKTSIASPLLFPNLAFLDARYTASLSPATTVNTAVDALCHCVESRLSVQADLMSAMIAEEGIRLIASRFGALKAGTFTPEDREILLCGSTLGGIAIAQTGTTVVHCMGYGLTYFRHIDHGRANGLLLAAFLDFLWKKSPALVAPVLAPMGFSTLEPLKEILSSLLGTRETFTEAELAGYAADAIKLKKISSSVVVPTQAELLDMYRASLL